MLKKVIKADKQREKDMDNYKNKKQLAKWQ